MGLDWSSKGQKGTQVRFRVRERWELCHMLVS